MGGREDLWKMRWSEINRCIKCNEGQNLLVCSENDCLLAVHEKCMGCPARFDDAGNFYCPHCFHRQAVRESLRAWENAISKKRVLSIFEMVGSKINLEEKTRAEANGLNQSDGDEDVNMAAFHVGKSAQGGGDVLHQSVGTDKDAQGSIHGECPANVSPLRGANESRSAYKSDTIKRNENVNGIVHGMEPIVARGNGVLCGEADRTSQQDGMLDRIETEECVDNHKLDKIIGDNENDAFTKGSAQVLGRSIPSRRQLDYIKMQEHKINTAEEESTQEEVSQSSRGSSGDELTVTVHSGSKRRLKRNDSSDVDSETVSVSNKRPTSNKNKNELKSQKRNLPRRSSSALRNIKEFDEQIGTSRRLNQSLTPSVNPASDLFFGGKRKKLMWRKDEEEMLKEGVQKFASTAKQNLPWRKILEFGRHVFEETRTPVDLKDKWRNLLAR